MAASLTKDEDYDDFMTRFFSANGELKVSEAQRQEALALCKQADKRAALACTTAVHRTDFHDDLPKVTVPTLVLHGDSDAIVPLEGSGERTHNAITGSELQVIAGAPHGCNVSHADEWNTALLAFLVK
jgi:pimeloyl-ACP methyl ester carboxylesterase